jgi:hypothetical protein
LEPLKEDKSSKAERYQKLERKNDHDHWIIGEKIDKCQIIKRCTSFNTLRT